MYIIVKYGNNESLLCNPNSAVVNLLKSIKRRTGYGNTNMLLDLSDETGLVKDLDVHKFDYATKHLTSHGTYILVQKEAVMDNDSLDSRSTPTPHQYSYTPLLDKYEELFPTYKVHVAEVIEKKKSKRMGSKSPSPAGRLSSKKTKSSLSKGSSRKR